MRDLSRQSGVPYSTIYDVLESGKPQPDNLTARNLKRLARTLGTSIDYLVGTWEDDQGNDEPDGIAVVGASDRAGSRDAQELADGVSNCHE